MPTSASRSSSPHTPEAQSPFITLENVTKTYDRGHSSVRALRSVSLEISEGAFLGVEGPSGSGKSTLLHLLAALDQPSAGSISVGDWRLERLNQTERSEYRRRMVGLVFQQFNLIPTMTARENVALPLVLAGVPHSRRTPLAMDCLEIVGLGGRMDHRPTELSGGEQQRVAAARALIGDPPLLLADEPTGNLDADTGAQIIDLLARLHREQDCTVIVVTHHIEEIHDVADRIVHLRDGALMVAD